MGAHELSSRAKAAASGALLVLLAACSGTPEPVIGPLAPQQVPSAGQQDFAASVSDSYLLRPADVVSISVFREPDLSLASVPVGADGSIGMPLIGAVQAAGRTPAELADAIRAALGRGYLNNPQVAVNVVEYRSHVVTVEGAVARSGVFPFAPGTRLSSAVALAGGPTRVARRDQIAVFRDTPDGMTAARFDYGAIQQGTMIDPVLEPGDRVIIGTSGRSQLWQDLLTSLPVLAIFSRI